MRGAMLADGIVGRRGTFDFFEEGLQKAWTLWSSRGNLGGFTDRVRALSDAVRWRIAVIEIASCPRSLQWPFGFRHLRGLGR